MIAILVGAIAMFAVGALWFTVLFGRTWSRLMRRTDEEMSNGIKGMGPKMAVMFVLNLISIAVMYYMRPDVLLFAYTQFLTSIILIWLGFTLPSLVNTYLWEGKSLKLVAINAGGSLAAFVAGSAAVFLLK